MGERDRESCKRLCKRREVCTVTNSAHTCKLRVKRESQHIALPSTDVLEFLFVRFAANVRLLRLCSSHGEGRWLNPWKKCMHCAVIPASQRYGSCPRLRVPCPYGPSKAPTNYPPSSTGKATRTAYSTSFRRDSVEVRFLCQMFPTLSP